MEVATGLWAASVASKLIDWALSAEKAVWANSVGELDARALKALVDLCKELVGGSKGGGSPADRRGELILAAFLRAFGAHWGGAHERVESMKAEVARRLSGVRAELAGEAVEALGAEAVEKLAERLGNPMATRAYRALWDTFAARWPKPDGTDAEPLFEFAAGGRQRFEQRFLTHYSQLLASDLGKPVRDDAVTSAALRAEAVRQLLAWDMVGWRRQHVFGNVPTRDDMMSMPLEDMYVEPLAVLAGAHDSSPEPVLRLLRRLLDDGAKVIVVQAHFGHGKSLTARTLASRWAEAFVTEQRPSTELPYPVFIKCADDILGNFKLRDVVARAMKRQSEPGLDLQESDEAFCFPPGSQVTRIILDGFDEVILSENESRGILRTLRGEATVNHRFLVFSRPGVIPQEKVKKDYQIPVVELRPFADAQIDDWLERWNGCQAGYPRLALASIRERDLAGLASTPILLFMIAHVWPELEDDTRPVGKAELYERFVRQLARAKANPDHDPHRMVVESSERIHAALVRLQKLSDTATPVDAMLWLMARAAWKSRQLAHVSKRLQRRHVSEIVQDELELGGDARDGRFVEVALLLALQASLVDDDSAILFGHQSFQEFLVAWYWHAVLERLSASRADSWRALETELHGARLFEDGDASFAFLAELLKRWPEDRIRSLLAWANDCFNSEHPFIPAPGHRQSADPMPYLREAALAIGNRVLPGGARIRDEATLKNLCAWFWVWKDRSPRIIAPGLQFEGVTLTNTRLPNADLTGAQLTRSTFEECGFRLTLLSNSTLTWTNWRGCDLNGANFRSARLQSARFVGGTALGTKFEEASLAKAQILELRAHGSSFRSATLTHAEFCRCDLRGTSLQGARLDPCTIRDSDLRGCDFTEATIAGLRLDGSIFDECTRWPGGFDPRDAGARYIPDS